MVQHFPCGRCRAAAGSRQRQLRSVAALHSSSTTDLCLAPCTQVALQKIVRHVHKRVQCWHRQRWQRRGHPQAPPATHRHHCCAAPRGAPPHKPILGVRVAPKPGLAVHLLRGWHFARPQWWTPYWRPGCLLHLHLSCRGLLSYGAAPVEAGAAPRAARPSSCTLPLGRAAYATKGGSLRCLSPNKISHRKPVAAFSSMAQQGADTMLRGLFATRANPRRHLGFQAGSSVISH